MKNAKLVAAIIIVAGLLIWPVGWQLYTYIPELGQFSQTEYTNFLFMAILGTYVASGLAAVYLRRAIRDTPKKEKHSYHGNPTANTTDIDKLTVDVAFLKERMKQVETKVTGLQVFFKSKETKEEKPSA